MTNKQKCDGTGGNEHIKRWCALPEPYPEPKVQGTNIYYASLLLEDYAGTISEMTAINQYIYHHLTFEKKEFEDLAELEECIAIIEMYHLELLGRTIALLGVSPEYLVIDKGKSVYWNASYVYYGKDICDRLDSDIKAEQQAIRQYREHQVLIRDPHIQELLERIIKDEEYHIKLFCQAFERYCPKIRDI